MYESSFEKSRNVRLLISAKNGKKIKKKLKLHFLLAKQKKIRYKNKTIWIGGRVVEGARLESVFRSKA